MNSFHFPLEKALVWRRAQLELAEARLQQQLTALAGLDRARLDLEALGQRTDSEVREFPSLAGEDLGALANFRRWVKARAGQLAAERTQCAREVAARQAALLEARRQSRLLERLKEKRWTEWQSARDRELEELAADSYLAQWSGPRA